MFFLGQQRSSLGDVDVVQSDVHDTCWLAGYDEIEGSMIFFKETSKKPSRMSNI